MKRNIYKSRLQRDIARQQKGKTHNLLWGLIMYGGTLGLLMVVPIVAGAYLGHWLDSQSPEYGTRWTVSLIVLGVVIGLWNVVRFIREHT